MLRVTQYLPDILYLQKLLFDQFHQRLDQGNALNMTIRDYLESLNNSMSYVCYLCRCNLYSHGLFGRPGYIFCLFI